LPSTDYPEATISQEIPVRNPLAKPEDKTRVLFLVPWLVVGGADKFNLDLVKTLTARGYEFTIATTLSSDNPWLHEFAKVTPDIFALQKFLAYADYPRFLDYLIESRQIDAILISQSQVGFGLVPYLRARHPNVAILDYLHVEEEHWKNGGYPGMAVRVGALIDRHVTCTHHLKRWMVKRGADPEAIDVCHANIDVNEWDPERVDTEDVRKRYDIPCDKPMVLFVGRIVDQKRPLVFAKIVHNLAQRGAEFTAVVVGDGDLLGAMKQYIHSHKLDRYVRFLGTQPSAQVQQLQAAADIFLLPSKYEGLALVLYECMAMKTVPVTTDFGGHPELVTPDCGYLIGKSDDEVEAYAIAVYELIQDPERRNRMAEAGRTRVCDHFAIEHMADGMHEAISTVRGIATARTSEISTVELEMARIAAHSAIEQFRLEVLTDYLWYVSHTTHRVDFVRRMRQKALPIGTRRYEIYKFGRQSLRFMLRGGRAGVSSGSTQRGVGVDRDNKVTVAALSEPISMSSVTMVEDVDAVTNVPSARPSSGANQ
jgi:glycosyltransferase involved in cell wall biosynthesis